MKTPIPWLRIVIEGVVIVGSILLAFGLQAWWEGRQDEQAAEGYLVRLASDFEIDEATWRLQSNQVMAKLEGLDRVLEWVRWPDQTQQAVDQLLADLTVGANMGFGGPAMNPLRSTFDELISTGALQLLRPGLRRSLLEYYKQIDFHRAQLVGRETGFYAVAYALVPRQPGPESSQVRTDLTPSDRLRIAERALGEDLEGLAIAERNRAQMHQQIAEDLLQRVLSVRSEIERDGE